MIWKALTEYCCPKCGGHLRLLKAQRVFICEADGFAITQKRRGELAKVYPRKENPRIEQHFDGITMMV